MLSTGSVFAFEEGTLVGCNTDTAVEAFNRLFGEADIQKLTPEPVGHAVEVVFHFDVVVDMNPCLQPVGKWGKLKKTDTNVTNPN